MVIAIRPVCHVASPDEVHAPSPANEVPPNGVHYQRTDYLSRRLRAAMFDLGIDRVLPNRWASPTIDGIAFNALSLRQAEELVRVLEDLAIDREKKAPTPGPGQLSLLEGDPQ